MRFDINRADNYMFVDDIYADMDTSALATNIVRVQWRETVGYIYLTTATLQQKITDPSPYQSFLNTWATARLTATPPLALAEAQQIKLELIDYLYDIKRQAPYAYTVAAGAYHWEATDGALANMTAAAIPAVVGGTSSGSSSLVSAINSQHTSLVNDINNNVVGGVNGTLVSQINSAVVAQGNTEFDSLVSVGNALCDFLDNTIIGTIAGQTLSGPNTLNNRLQHNASSNAGTPGLNAALAHNGHTWAVGSYMSNVPGGIAGVGNYPIGSGSGPGTATLQWTPIESATPVTISLTEAGAIMSGITSRRATLLTTRTNKKAAVNAMTDIATVIAYDATAGW
jgi:hypothetical protein